jgi:hypothetical protein
MTKALAKTFAALLAAVSGTVLALNGARVLHISLRVVVASVITSAALAAITTIGSAWGEWRGRRLAERRELAAISLEAAAWAIVDQVGHGLDYRDLGVAAYRVGHRWWWPFRPLLVRVERVRPSRRPVASHVSWRPGKGVIGACVARGEVVAVDVAQMYRDLGSPTEEEWETVPAEIRQGLSYAEYLDVRDKYGVVIAAPIIDDTGQSSSVVGCIALDGPDGRFAELQSDEVLGLLNSTASTLLHQVR